MEKSDNEVRSLSKNTSNVDFSNFNETEIARLIQALDEKIKLLENRNKSTEAMSNQRCTFKDTCYTAKSNLGSCPCEHYR